jgi:hypothetical protein
MQKSNNNNIDDLIATLQGTAIGPGGIVHTPPKYIRRVHRHGSLKNSTRPTKFKLAKPTFIHKVYVPTEHRRFPRRSLLNTKHRTAKLRALNQRRRGVILGLKKQTRRPEQKSTRKSTRRKSVK